MNRTPPRNVRQQLRKEVFWGCPIPGCGAPYLEWHHFDPPWSIENHHRPEGMIALCPTHHSQADGGAFTSDQLHKYKAMAAQNAKQVQGEFLWRRNDFLIHLGGNYYTRTNHLLTIKDKDIIWLSRDPEGNALINIDTSSIAPEPRLVIEENVWLAHGNQEDCECPPSGRLIHVKYKNGDEFKVEFKQCDTPEDLKRLLPTAPSRVLGLKTPLTLVEAVFKIEGLPVKFDSLKSSVGIFGFKNCLFDANGHVFKL